MSIYLNLTREFNRGGVRAILAGGQAVVMHRLAIMSKDGDWIIREDESSLSHILAVLEDRGAGYRFGAPLDVRWMQGGWSSHFEFNSDGLRIRTDFVTRPPRISEPERVRMWQEAESALKEAPYVDACSLAELKKTNREKDYAVIGELARLIESIEDRLLYSRSARDIIELAGKHPEVVEELANQRKVLSAVGDGRTAMETALDAERRRLMRTNEERLKGYVAAAKAWRGAWPEVQKKTEGLSLREAHDVIVEEAEKLLPFDVEEHMK